MARRRKPGRPKGSKNKRRGKKRGRKKGSVQLKTLKSKLKKINTLSRV